MRDANFNILCIDLQVHCCQATSHFSLPSRSQTLVTFLEFSQEERHFPLRQLLHVFSLQHPLMIKKKKKEIENLLGYRGVYRKPVTHIVHNGERLNYFPLEQEQGRDICSHHSYST